MTTDMTSGSAYRHLWRHALPLMLGNWFQLCYNAADSVIAGRFIGAHALAAEGAAGPVMNLVILAISGVTVGAGGCGAGKARREERRLPAGGKKTAKKGPAARNGPIKTGRFG
ncbi:hypothetical protein [uncultured Subdoligranulum sp.]|uniref:hypothetical protein n=1 Tax=uncultured Subdoligranulum sp. TaxID=512298 RepID=UPI0025D66266|nr:hypothetical protein [uncultured Subdoligranulum sp.]